MVAFGFLSQNFGRWWGLTSAILSFYDCRLIGGNTQTLSVIQELNFLHSQVAGMQKHPACALTPKPSGETFTNYFTNNVCMINFIQTTYERLNQM